MRKIILSIFLIISISYGNFPSAQEQFDSITNKEEQKNNIKKPDLSCNEENESNCLPERHEGNTYSTLEDEEAGELDYELKETELGTVLNKKVEEIKFDDGYIYYLNGEEVSKEEYEEYEGEAYTLFKINGEEVTEKEYNEEKETATESSISYYDNPKMKVKYYVGGEEVSKEEYNSNTTEISEKKYYIDETEVSKENYNGYKSKRAKSNYKNILNFFSNEAVKDENAMNTVNNSFLTAEDKDNEVNEFGEVKTRKNLYKKHFDIELDKMNTEYLKGQNPEDDRLLALDKTNETRDQLKLNWSAMSKDTIKCSISRKLIPGYVCPFLDKNNTVYGGTIEDSIEEKKEECEDNCKETYTCASKEIEGSVKAGIGEEYPKEKFNFSINDFNNENNYRVNVDINEKQETREILIKLKGKWKREYSNEERTLNGEYLYGIEKDRVYYNTFVKYSENDWVTLMDRNSIPLVKPEEDAAEEDKIFEAEIRIPFGNVLEEMEFQIYPPQDLDLEDFHAESIEIVYSDSDMWFCPDRQEFNPSLRNCDDGVLKAVTLKSGVRMKMCIKDNTKIGPETEFGAFYSKESCENNCYKKRRCEPTYKHFRTNSLKKQNYFQIDVSCYDLGNNSSCTEELCREYINGNKEVLNEWNLNSKDKMETIVKYGILQEDKVRPKVDLTKEVITESSSDEDIRKLEISTQKDSAYLDMINQQSFNYITEPLGESTEQQNAYEREKNGDAFRYSWILKPKSEDFDKKMYLYTVVEFDQTFYPKYGEYVLSDSLNSGVRVINNDPLMQIKDRTYMIKKNDGSFKVFRKIENSHFYINVKELDERMDPPEEVLRRKWVRASEAYYKDNIVKYIGGELREEIGSNQAEYFTELDMSGFDRDKTVFRYKISDDLLTDINEVLGGLLKEQLTIDHGVTMKRSYTGEDDMTLNGLYKGTLDGMKIYGIYSPIKLSYNDIVDKLKNETTIYDIKGAFLYSKDEVEGDQEYRNNIRLFKQGEIGKSTIHMGLKPLEKEIGKRGFIFLFLY